MSANQFGLARDIPDATKRIIRSAAGYGCVICGNAIYQYEHVDPEFANAKEHDPERITLLCASCHDKVTRGIWSKEKVLSGMRAPKATVTGHSSFTLDIASAADVVVRVGNYSFVGAKDIITIDGTKLLSIDEPEQPGSPLRISAAFYDRNNSLIARIVENEWQGNTEAFDIEVEGKRLRIRSARREIDLVPTVDPPNGIAVEQLCLRYNGKTIIGDRANGFKIATAEAYFRMPESPAVLRKAASWITIVGERISIGTDKAIEFMSVDGSRYPIAGTVEIEGAGIEYVDPEKEGIPLPPGRPPGSKIMKFTKLVPEGKAASAGFNIPVVQPRPGGATGARPAAPKRSKIGRNDPCPSCSGKKYKRCHGAT